MRFIAVLALAVLALGAQAQPSPFIAQVSVETTRFGVQFDQLDFLALTEESVVSQNQSVDLNVIDGAITPSIRVDYSASTESNMRTVVAIFSSVDGSRIISEEALSSLVVPPAGYTYIARFILSSIEDPEWSGELGSRTWRLFDDGQVVSSNSSPLPGSPSSLGIGFVLGDSFDDLSFSFSRVDTIEFAVTYPLGIPCSIADLIQPLGVLDVSDVDSFITLFLSGDTLVDFDNTGIIDLDDIDLFISSYLAGCP